MNLKYLASTKSTFYGSIPQSLQNEDVFHSNYINSFPSSSEFTFPILQSPKFLSTRHSEPTSANFVHRAVWCSDGSSFATHSEDNAIRVYIAPADLPVSDNNSDSSLLITPYIRYFHQNHIINTDLHPHSSLYNSSLHTLISCNQLPLVLKNLIPNEYQSVMSYNTVNQQTEQFQKIYTVKFLDDCSIFAGSNKQSFLLDINRSDPVISNENNAVGIISCCQVLNSQYLNNCYMIGTFSNVLQIIDFSTNEIVYEQKFNQLNGISQLIESFNGNFIFIISRNCNKVLVLDVRLEFKVISELLLPPLEENNNQRIFGDVMSNSKGLLIGSHNSCLHWFKDAELGMDSNHDMLKIPTSGTISNINFNPVENFFLMAVGDRNSPEPELSINKLTDA